MLGRLLRGVLVVSIAGFLAAGLAGCDEPEEEGGTRWSVHVNLLPDAGLDGGLTIHFQTDL